MIDELLKRNVRIRALVRNRERGNHLSKIDVEIAEGDLGSFETLQRAVQGVYGVYHLGAAFREAKLPDSEYFRINVEGTRKLLQASVESGVKRFIYCSTNGVHGDIKNPPADEAFPYAPCDIYQESKVASEKVVFEFLNSGQIRGIYYVPR